MITRPAMIGMVAFFAAVSVHPIFYIGVALMILDVRARYKDYLRLKDTKFDTKIAEKFGRSWCGRGVCEYIWVEEAENYFYSKGYRWYHIFPDGFPGVFLRLDFWKSVVGVR